MKTLHVGGMNPIGRFKTFEEALVAAQDDDTIKLHKNVTIVSQIHKNIIIDGGDKTITVPSGKAGLICDKPIIIQNVNFKIESRANALVIRSSCELHNVRVSLVGPIRQFYPVISVGKGEFTTGSLVAYDSTLLGLSTEMDTAVKLYDSSLVNYYGGDIHLATQADHSNIRGAFECHNSTLRSVTFSGRTTIVDSTLVKNIIVKSELILQNSVLAAQTEEPLVKLKKEPSTGPLRDADESRYVLQLDGATATLDNYQCDVKDNYLGIYAVDSRIAVMNSHNEDDTGVNLVRNSTLSFTDCNDNTYWAVEDTTSSLVRSTANLSQQVKTAMEKLNELIGLSAVKNKLTSIMNTIKANQQSTSDNFGFSYHMVFAGDPGTGKTTVAKIVAQALFEIGAIPENKCTEVTVDTLIKGYVGQTANNVREILDDALGGVLFIDEAYELTVRPGEKSFNSEALSVLIRYMEDHRDDLVVIAAGYNKEMKEFLASNAGLPRRFQWIDFEDYTPAEMSNIFELVRKSYDMEFDTPELVNGLPDLFTSLVALNLATPDAQGRITNGGNGGLVRNVYQQVMEHRNNRMMLENTTPNITKDDLLAGFRDELVKAQGRKL